MSVAPDSYANLRSAAQYVRAFRGKTFVFKLGGEVLEDPAVRRAVCEQLAVLWSFSIKLVLVHGGGTGIDALCETLQLPVEKVAGRRVTTAKVLDAAKMVLAGSLHTDLLADLRAAGLPVTGVSGVDGWRKGGWRKDGRGEQGQLERGCLQRAEFGTPCCRYIMHSSGCLSKLQR